MRNIKALKILILLISSMIFITYINSNNDSILQYKISRDEVKSVYCEYYMNKTKIIPVSDKDVEIILPEIIKMKKVNTIGKIGTIPYRFVIELTNGKKFEFMENTWTVITLYSTGGFYKQIKTPKTSEFIRRYKKENNIVVENVSFDDTLLYP